MLAKVCIKTSDSMEVDRLHSWHPFTQMSEYLGLPRLEIKSGSGCWLSDRDGRRYLDCNASIWTNVHGHGDPELNAALKEQLNELAHSTWLGLSHEAGNRLTEKLISLTPEPLTRVFYSDNGSNAVEIALKLSFQYWQQNNRPAKTLAVSMENAYHGDTFGTMSVSGSEGFHGRFSQWCFESRRFPAPQEDNDEASLAALRKLLEKEHESIACLLLEPWIQGAAGMQVQPFGFVAKIADICKEFDVHLILDEVFVGFGRCGSFFVCEREKVVPDFLCTAKGLSAGYLPMAATLTNEQIYNSFLGGMDRAFFHGHTYTANPLASAVSLKSAEMLETMIHSGKVNGRIDYFNKALRNIFSNHPNVAAIRQRGLAAAIDLKPTTADNFPPEQRTGMKICIEARKHGLLLRPLRDTLLFVPPLVISDDEIDFLFENTTKAIDKIL